MNTRYQAPQVPPRSTGTPIATSRDGTRGGYVPRERYDFPHNDFKEDVGYKRTQREQDDKRHSREQATRVANEDFEAKERRRAEDQLRRDSDLRKKGEHARLAEEEEKHEKKERQAKQSQERARGVAEAKKLKSSQSAVPTKGFYPASGSSSAKQSSSTFPTLESRTGLDKKPSTYSSKKGKVIDVSTPDSSPEKKRKPSTMDMKLNKKSKTVIDISDHESPQKPKPIRVKSPSRSVSPSQDFASVFAAKKDAERAKEEQEARAEKRKRKLAEEKKAKSRKKIVLDSSDEDAEVLGSEDMADELELVMREEEELVKNGGEVDRILQRDLLAPDPSVPLCPFCSAPLPLNPSARLQQTKADLLARPTIQRAPTIANPGGMKLPIVQTAGFCSLHRAEMTVIPEGIARGWPTEIDFVGLAKRIKAEGTAKYLISIITRQTESVFYNDAVEQWAAQGTRRAVTVLAQMETFDVEQPGYYGPQGYEYIMKALETHFVDTCRSLTTSSASPLSIQDYLRKVLLPEAAISLIAQDQKCTRDEAAEIRKESVGFGVAVFGMSKEEEEYLVAEARREEKEKLKKLLRGEREEEGRSQEKEKKEREEKTQKRIEKKQQNMMQEFTAKPKAALRKPKKALALQN